MTQRPRFDDDLPIDPDLAPDDPAEPSTHPRTAATLGGRGRARPGVLAAIAVGGSLGTLARAALGVAIPTPSGGLPWTTLTINVVGSLLLGVVVVVLVDRLRPPPVLRPLLTTGFLGGFTTFSTFMVDTAQLGRHGHVVTAVAYLVASIAVGVTAAWVGIVAGRRLANVARAEGTTR